MSLTNEQVDAAVERYTDRLLDLHLGTGPEPCCKICRFRDGEWCALVEYIDMDLEEGDDGYRKIDPDDWCDHFELYDIPEW